MNSIATAPSRSITVPFHGAHLHVIEHEGQPYTPMRPIVEAVGVSWQGQHEKLTANEARWGIKEILTPSNGGMQTMTSMPLRKLAGWLMTLSPGKIKSPEVRARVIQYQNECDDILWKYWNEGLAVNPRYVRISPSQAQDLKEHVNLVVASTGQTYGAVWARLHNKFRVSSYLELPAEKHWEAREYLLAKIPPDFTPITSIPNLEEPHQVACDHATAFKTAVEVSSRVQEYVYQQVLETGMWKHRRWLLRFDFSREGSIPKLSPIEHDVCMLPINRFHEAIHNSLTVKPETLSHLIKVCSEILEDMAKTRSTPIQATKVKTAHQAALSRVPSKASLVPSV